MPSPARPTAIATLVLVTGVFIVAGLAPAITVALAALMGWTTGVLHERYAGQI